MSLSKLCVLLLLGLWQVKASSVLNRRTDPEESSSSKVIQRLEPRVTDAAQADRAGKDSKGIPIKLALLLLTILDRCDVGPALVAGALSYVASSPATIQEFLSSPGLLQEVLEDFAQEQLQVLIEQLKACPFEEIKTDNRYWKRTKAALEDIMRMGETVLDGEA